MNATAVFVTQPRLPENLVFVCWFEGDMEKEPATPQKSHQTSRRSRQLWNKWATGQAVSFFYLNLIFRGVKCVEVLILKSKQGFLTATNNVETSHTNTSTLTLIASDFCWQGFHYWLRDNKAVHWEPRPNNCIVHVQALSWGQPE